MDPERQPLLTASRLAATPTVFTGSPAGLTAHYRRPKVCGCVQPAALALAWISLDLVIVLLMWAASFRFDMATLLSDVEPGGWRDYHFRTGFADVAVLTVAQMLVVAASFSHGKSRHRTAVASFLLCSAILNLVKFAVVLSQNGRDEGQGSDLKLVMCLVAVGISALGSTGSAAALLMAVRVNPELAALLQSRGVHGSALLYTFISPWSHWRRELWLLLSSFGIVFAIFSFLQDTDILDHTFLCPYNEEEGCRLRRPWIKFMLACVLGAILYFVVAREHDNLPKYSMAAKPNSGADISMASQAAAAANRLAGT